MTARRFYREQRPPDFEGIGSPEIGRQYAMQIRAQSSRWSAARTVALRQCFIEGVGVWARCDRPVGLTVVMETLPLSYASRTAASAAARASHVSFPVPRRLLNARR